MSFKNASTKSLKKEIKKLRLELHQHKVYKSGILDRYRETIIMGFNEWKPRYYEIRCNRLVCYKSLVERDVRFELPLINDETNESVHVVIPDGDKSQDDRYEFEIDFPTKLSKKSFHLIRLAAKSDEERKQWMESIETSIQDALEDRRYDEEPQAPPSPTNNRRKGRRKHDAGNLTTLVHKVERCSLLSSENMNKPDLRGFFNLIMVVAVATNFRLIVENFMKYGIIVHKFQLSDYIKTSDVDCIICFVELFLHIIVAWQLELHASQKRIERAMATSLHGFNCCLCLAIPVAVTSHTNASLPIAGFVLSMSVVIFMKIVSYAHTNSAYRKIYLSNSKHKASNEIVAFDAADDENDQGNGEGEKLMKTSERIQYPNNVTFKNICVFIFMPTLVYQASYPRTERIRKRWLLKRFGELLLCIALMFVAHFQFVRPTLENAKEAIRNKNAIKLLERLLKLAIPSLITWLLLFYGLFHLWLNILAELTCFGDRLFYTHWWNAKRLDQYWRCWNIPVHNWLLRHVYFPVLGTGVGKTLAGLIVFVISAALHELIASGALQELRVWIFMGMLLQLPAIMLTSYLDKKIFKGSELGNVLFWFFFCIVGQPMILMLYYADLAL